MNRFTPFLLIGGALVAGIFWMLPKSPPDSEHTRHTVNPSHQLLNKGIHDPRASSTGAPVPSPAPALVPDDLSGKITQALRIGGASGRDHALNQLLPRLLAQDRTTAAKLALGWTPGAVRDELLAHLVRQWSETDIHAALTWVAALGSADDRSLAASAVIDKLAQHDPAGALELARIFHSGTRDGSAERRAQLWAEDSPTDAVAWITTQPAGDDRDRLLIRIAHVRARHEPAEAASLVLNHMRASEARDDALLTVVRQWTLRDPAGAEAWVSRFPPGPLLLRARSTMETARKHSAL